MLDRIMRTMMMFSKALDSDIVIISFLSGLFVLKSHIEFKCYTSFSLPSEVSESVILSKQQ